MTSTLVRGRGFAGWRRYGFAFVAALILGRLPAALGSLWARLPQEVQEEWPWLSLLMPLLALATLFPGGSGGGRRGRRGRGWAGSACAVLGLVALGLIYFGHVVTIPGKPVEGGDDRQMAFLVGSQDLPETCSSEAKSPAEFVKLHPEREKIDGCWGADLMKRVRLLAWLSYAVTLAGLGILVGLACARRYEPLVEPAGTQIFLSYSTEDAEAAAGLAKALSAGGVKVFYAPESIRGSQSFPQRIEAAIAACRVGVILWSAAAEGSAWVTKERSMLTLRSVEQKVPLQVVRLEDREVPLALRDLQRIDAFAEWRPGEIAAAILRDTGVEKALREGEGAAANSSS
jgi:TIR domain